MASLPIYDRNGEKVGDYELDWSELAPRINKQLLHDAVVMYQANQRQGTFKTKGRGEVAGSTRKLYRQKGTGNARVGPRRTGKRVGGGHTFAKRPRDFGYSLPRKALRLATRMALAGKVRSGQVIVIDQLTLSEPKTREMSAILERLKLAGSTVLIVTAGYGRNVLLSARNIPGVSVSPAAELNALVVLRPQWVIVTKDALDGIRAKARAGQPATVGA